MTSDTALGSAPLPSTDDALLQRAIALVRDARQVDLSDYRASTFERQLRRRMAELGERSLASYLDRLEKHPDEVQQLRQSLLISVTRFFRDAPVFEHLGQVLHDLVLHHQEAHGLRIWAPGCATGEEAYSVAMLLAEALEATGRALPARLYATDVDSAAVVSARRGRYALADLADLPADRLARHFVREGEHAVVSKPVRDLCVFAEHDLLTQPPFIHMDLVICRNVLIYFEAPARAAVISRFSQALRPGGLLLLGQSESLTGEDPWFSPYHRPSRLYRRRIGGALGDGRHAGPALPTTERHGRQAQPAAPSLEQRFHDWLLRRDARPSVVVTATGQVLHLWGAVEPLLQLGSGTDLSMHNVLRPELRREARSLLRLALAQPERAFSSPWLALRLARGATPVRLCAQVLPDCELASAPVVLSFELGATGLDQAVSEPGALAAHDLADELALAREQLHTLAEALERSESARHRTTEELQVSSEELQASNEELQASNEELLSLNEQLTAKSSELGELNDLLLNIEGSVNLSMVALDAQLCVQRYNPAAVRVFGLMPSDIGRPLASVPCSLQLPQLLTRMALVLQSGQMLTERIDQGDRHFVMQLAPLRDRRERVAGVIVCFTDVADMHAAEIERARLAAIVASSEDAIVGKSLDGLITSWNPGAERLFGYPAEEALGQPMLMVFPHELRHEESELLGRVARGETVASVDTVRQRKDGTRIHVSATLSPIRDALGRIVGVSTIARDIGSRVADEALRAANLSRLEELVAARTRQVTESERFVQSILQGMPGFVAYWDGQLQPRLANDAQARLLDELARAPEQASELARLLHPGRCELTREHARAALQGEARSFELALTQAAADSPSHLSLSYRPQWRDGVIDGFIALGFDISAVRQAQQVAQAASRAKSDFLASVSHEIRTPLNGVLGLAQLGQRQAPDDATRDGFSRIVDAGQHLLGLINDVLDFSRIEAGKMDLRPADVALQPLMRRALGIVRPQADAKGLRLHLDCPADLPTQVRADPTRLTQLLINLLGNAVKFTRAGEVRLQAERDGPMLVFRIRDTGSGIEPELLPRLFTPFERGDTSRTRRTGGSGLGLAICKRLTEQMDGQISLSSHPGRGTTVTLRLPLPIVAGALAAPALAPVAPAVSAPGGPRLLGRRLLVAEDNPVNMAVFCEMLQLEGAEVRRALDGREALALFEAAMAPGGPGLDAVLCDIEMPELDGYEVTRRLRAQGHGVPVVGLTAHAFDDARQHGLDAGMSGYLTKPVMLDELVAELLRHLPPADTAQSRRG